MNYQAIPDDKLAAMAQRAWEGNGTTTSNMAAEMLALRRFRDRSLNPTRDDPKPQPVVRTVDGKEVLTCVHCGYSDSLIVVGEMEEWRDVDPVLTVWEEPVVTQGDIGAAPEVYRATMTCHWEQGNGTDSEGEWLRCKHCVTEMAMPKGIEVDWE